MPRRMTGENVVESSLARLEEVYREGSRVVVSFSAGKDSGVTLELAIEAARRVGRLPVDVVMRDEEVMFPGTYEYSDRIANRPEVNFHWLYACQPSINIFNRAAPYWWVFDPELPAAAWVRQPPASAYRIREQHIGAIVSRERFPPDEGQRIYTVTGLRVSESINRLRGIFASGGYMTRNESQNGSYYLRPIYDWKDADIWKAIHDFGWDYNSAYDVMARLGVQRAHLRIAPPTMNKYGIPTLALAARAWPRWFDSVCARLPGCRAAAHFGKRAIEPTRRFSETWKDAYHRINIAEAPDWIAKRARIALDAVLDRHAAHSSDDLPENLGCSKCASFGSYMHLTRIMYNGDPFLTSLSGDGKVRDALGYVQPEFFRPGAGEWGGKPSW